MDQVRLFGCRGNTSWAVQNTSLLVWGYFDGKKILSPLTLSIPEFSGDIVCADISESHLVMAINNKDVYSCITYKFNQSIISGSADKNAELPDEFPYCPIYKPGPILTESPKATIIHTLQTKPIQKLIIIGPGVIIHYIDGSIDTKLLASNPVHCIGLPTEAVKHVECSKHSLMIVTTLGSVMTWTAEPSTWKPEGFISLCRGLPRQIQDKGTPLWGCIHSKAPVHVGKFENVEQVAIGWDSFLIAAQ